MKTSFATGALAVAAVLGFLVGFIQSPTSQARSRNDDSTPAPTAHPNIGASDAEADTGADAVLGRAMRFALERGAFASPDLYGAVEQLSESQIRKALKRVSGVSGGHFLAEALAARLVRIDPSAGSTAFAEAGDGAQQTAYSGLIVAWARFSPDAAWAAAQRVPGSRKAKVVFSEVIRQIAKQNPEDALAKLAILDDSAQRDALRTDCVRVWAESSPEGAAAWILENIAHIPLGNEGSSLISTVIPEIAGKQPALAQSLVEQLPQGFTDKGRKAVFLGMTRRQPVQAFEYAEAHRLAEKDISLASSQFIFTMRQAPEEITNWLAAKPADGKRDNLVMRAISDAPPQVVGKLYALLSDSSKPYAIASYMKATFSGSPEKARAFSSGQTDTVMSAKAMRAYGREFNHPGIPNEIEQLQDDAQRNALRLGHIDALSKANPAQAAAELLKLPASYDRREAFGSMIAKWQIKDAEAASLWLKENGAAMRIIR